MRNTNGNPKCKNEDGTPKVDKSKRTTLLTDFVGRGEVLFFTATAGPKHKE